MASYIDLFCSVTTGHLINSLKLQEPWVLVHLSPPCSLTLAQNSLAPLRAVIHWSIPIAGFSVWVALVPGEIQEVKTR